MRRGRQTRVRSPGINRKQTVFGAFCYGRGLFVYHVQPRKSAWGRADSLAETAPSWPADRSTNGRRGGSRFAASSEVLTRYLEDVKEHLEVFWLPHYSPELNLIERLWRYLKASRMANVLFPSFRAFTEHLSTMLTHFALHPDFVSSVAEPTRQTMARKNTLVAT